MTFIPTSLRRKRCCECNAKDKRHIIQWCEPAQYVCISCAWELGYTDYCYETCRPR